MFIVLVVEEILYDFGAFPGYADDFVRNLLNLMIISKMNAAIKNLISKNYFVHLISQIYGEFVKSFDSLASMTKTKVKWGIMKEKEDKPDPLFALLDSFVGAVIRLTSLDPSNPDSLVGKRFGIRNASIIRKSLHLEFLINSNLNIMELNPHKKHKDDAIKLLFGRPEFAKVIVSLMNQ